VMVPVPESKPKAIRKHSTMLVPVVDEVIDPVARQVAALPAAKGPRAVVQRATFPTSTRPLEFSMSVHDPGRVVIHRPSSAVRIHSAISAPTVNSEGVVATQVAMFPAANGPRATVQAAITGTNPRPSVVLRASQPRGRATSQNDDVDVADGMQSDAEEVWA
jgi:hypothetical protein